MTNRRAISILVSVSVAFIIIAAVIISLYYLPSDHSSTTTPPATVCCTPTRSSSNVLDTNAPSGLLLVANVSTPTINSGDAISASAQVYNNLSTNITAYLTPINSTIGNWIWIGYNGDLSLGCTRPQYILVDLVIFQGRFTNTNISSAGKPLQLSPEATLSCTSINSTPDNVVFLPHSSTVVCSVKNAFCPSGSQILKSWYSTNGSIKGYWRNGSYSNFVGGEYTIVAFDHWGRLKFLYFHVT